MNVLFKHKKLKNLTIDNPGAIKTLSTRLYSAPKYPVYPTGRSYSKRQKTHELIFITGRVLALSAALALMIYSVLWKSDESWETVTLIFFAGMIFFIPFILFGRKIKTLKKGKKYTKRNNAIIGWRYSGS